MSTITVSFRGTPIQVFVAGSAITLVAGQAAEEATAQAEAAQDAAQAAQDSAAEVVTYFNSVRTATIQANASLPLGWIEPGDYPDIDYTNHYGVKFWSDGLKVHVMWPDDTALSGWRTGGPKVMHPDDGLFYVSISLARKFDPTRQGSVVQHRYVNNITGNDTTGDGTSGLPWKTVNHAITTINAHASVGPWQVNVSTSSFLGGNSAGWTSANLPIAANKLIKIIGVGSTKPWVLPGMRNSYTKATFAWVSMGNGIWKTSAGGISATAKNTPIVFDLSVLDDNGMPTPSAALAGPYADEAAILAAMAVKPSLFYQSSTTTLYVKLSSGAEPDPGVNFAYSELKVGNRFDIGEGARLVIENFRSIFNAETASTAIWYRFRPTVYTIGPAAPNVVHDNAVVLIGCEHYGSSGNAFAFESITNAILENCTDGYNWLDGVNSHSLYTYPANSVSPLEGSGQHTFIDGHLSLFHGANGFKTQPTVNASSNTITDHDRGRTTVINSRGAGSNGSGIAFVGGSKCLAINCGSYDPKYVAPATDTYTAPYLSSGYAVGDITDPSEVWGLFCNGSVRPNGRTFYVGSGAGMVQVNWPGSYSKQVDGTGTLTDGFGVPL